MKKSDISIALKTMAIKARVANRIRSMFYKRKLSDTFLSTHPSEISQMEANALFTTIFNLNREMHLELNAYKSKRQRKAAIETERQKRGFTKRKKTSKAEYEARKVA